MIETLKQCPLRLSWNLPYVWIMSPRETVILEYHGIPWKKDQQRITASEFDSHIAFLKCKFDIVPADKIGQRRKATDRGRVALTFDDGFRNQAEVVAPILRRHRVPAIFFVSSRHSTPGKYLWFSYLEALEKHFPSNGLSFRGEFLSMFADQRQTSIRRLREILLKLTPHPAAMYQAIEEELPRLEDFVAADDLNDCYSGMTAEQVCELAADSRFKLGVHTVDHPLLTRCEPDEALRQIVQNEVWLEQITGKKCDSIAYPGGDYNLDVLKQCRQLDFTRGYVENSRLGVIPDLEVPRIGIYSPSLDILGLKAQWGMLMRSWHLNVG